MTRKKKNSRNKSRFKTTIALFWLMIICALSGLAVYAGINLEKNTIVQQVNFSGNNFTDNTSLYEAIESPVGVLADSVNYDNLFDQLKNLPYVRDSGVHMSIRGTLTFRITEHEPLAMLVDGAHRIYVAPGGIKLPVVPGKIKDVPLVYGFPVNPVSDTLKTEAYKQVEEFLISAKSNEIGWITISEVSWTPQEGVVALSHENGVKLIFGRDDFAGKMQNWEIFYTEVIGRIGIHSFSNIDLRYKDQIVTQNL